MTPLQRLTSTTAPLVDDLVGRYDGQATRGTHAAHDNRASWDNQGGTFDNRASWDNWSK
ncbi:hypothetical protein OG320_15575 [Microbispora sp. NBC_01189]|uniref:multiple cyclophane-containing RiPP AmcA n=1 Tax=Microbispora sp. NBC_01189 TaxID=2903583 RepID=UPI002E0E6DBC|nr:hypothetical protein OG320_15575 [Microbispora sp. NBC_01189]